MPAPDTADRRRAERAGMPAPDSSAAIAEIEMLEPLSLNPMVSLDEDADRHGSALLLPGETTAQAEGFFREDVAFQRGVSQIVQHIVKICPPAGPQRCQRWQAYGPG